MCVNRKYHEKDDSISTTDKLIKQMISERIDRWHIEQALRQNSFWRWL